MNELRALVEGNSLRSTTWIAAVPTNTVSKLVVDLGAACEGYILRHVVDLPATWIECDEIWAFCHTKARNVPEERRDEWGIGDVWTWGALDPDTKLICSWLVGRRDGPNAMAFLMDLASRLRNRVQITTDGHRPYIEAIEQAFGMEVDYAMLIKESGLDPSEERSFSPPVVLSEEVRVITGNPDPDRITTSYVARQNLTMRMGMRRFTRLTNGFSKNVENHAAAIAIHYIYVNYARPMKILANPYPRTPAIAAGLADHIWTCEEIADLLD